MAEQNYLEMSDEELLNGPMPTEEPVNEYSDDSDLPDAVEDETPEPAAEEVPKEETAEAGEDAAGVAEATQEPIRAASADDAGETVETGNPETAAAKQVAPSAATLNYEAEIKRLLAPFKANGREMQVDNVDDAISLMQMGANYNRKMAGMKPGLKVLKLLENNGLLDEAKIAYLIDLQKKDPAAINKLISESGIDPMDLDAGKASEYQPKTYTVNDQEIELDTVLDELKDSPTYTRTLDVVSNKWDGASKQEIAKAPQLLKVINSHIDSGIYDIINTAVERERTLGRLNGLTDIQAYQKVGDYLNAQGSFNHLNQPVQRQAPGAPVVVVAKPAQANDARLNDKRRAASSTKPAAPKAVANEDYNPLAMSDDAFGKIVNKKYL